MRLPRLRRQPVRNVEIGELQDTFLVCAVATILVIRLQLWLTNYPQLSPGRLHIAHLLWGGLLMLIALGLLLSFLGRSQRTTSAIVGGIGFGFFIDELGKFITADNDYFFKPTAALIYVIFVALFLAGRNLQRRRGFTQREYLVNAIELIAEAARHDLDEREKRRALELLARCGDHDELVRPLRSLLRELDAIPTPAPSRPARAALAVRAWYLRLIERPRFARLMGSIFVAWALLSLVQVLALVVSVGYIADGHSLGAIIDRAADRAGSLSFIGVASVASSVGAAVLVAAGALRLRAGERLAAYRRFDRALLVQIFITQVFVFVESQFTAVFGLGVDILLLVTVRYMTRAERAALARRRPPPPAPSPPAVTGEPATA